MESTRERLIRYLNDAWAVEKALVTDLGKMASEVDQGEISALFTDHCSVTHQQEENLEARIRALGGEPSGGKGFLSQMMSAVGGVLHAPKDECDQVTQDLIKAYASESFEIAMYSALESFATAIGDTETAQIASQHRRQEQEMADRVWSHIPTAAIRPLHAAGRVGGLAGASDVARRGEDLDEYATPVGATSIGTDQSFQSDERTR